MQIRYLKKVITCFTNNSWCTFYALNVSHMKHSWHYIRSVSFSDILHIQWLNIVYNTTDTPNWANYLDLRLEFDEDGRLYTRLCVKRDHFSIYWFPLVFGNRDGCHICGRKYSFGDSWFYPFIVYTHYRIVFELFEWNFGPYLFLESLLMVLVFTVDTVWSRGCSRLFEKNIYSVFKIINYVRDIFHRNLNSNYFNFKRFHGRHAPPPPPSCRPARNVTYLLTGLFTECDTWLVSINFK